MPIQDMVKTGAFRWRTGSRHRRMNEKRKRRLKALGRWSIWVGLIFAVVFFGVIGYVHKMVASWGPAALDEVFVDVPVPVSRTYELPDGRRLHTAETGNADGPLVIFIHGTPGRWEDFMWVMRRPELADRALLVSVDRLGWGESADGGLETSLPAQARALRPILRAHEGNLPAIVVGHSLGAPIAAQLAMDEPEAIGAVVLVSGSIDPALEKTTWYQAAVRMWPVRWAIPKPLVLCDDELIPFRAELETMRPGWSTLQMPVTVVQGDEDRLVPPANADFAQREIVNAPLTMRRVPEIGHMIPWQRPDLIADAVMDYLPGLSPIP